MLHYITMTVCSQLFAQYEKEEELASTRSDKSDDDESEADGDENVAAERRPEDKENTSPNDASVKLSERAKARTGVKRKRQTAEKAHRQAQDKEATRRRRIRQYYNGATHGSASAVQLFAMAMQARYAEEAYVLQSTLSISFGAMVLLMVKRVPRECVVWRVEFRPMP